MLLKADETARGKEAALCLHEVIISSPIWVLIPQLRMLEQAGAARCLKWIIHKEKRIRRLPVQLYHRLKALIPIVKYAEFLHRYTALGYG